MQPAKPPAQSAVPRRVLAQHLRDLRWQAGLTVKLPAEMFEWSEPKLWRIETGQSALRALDVLDCKGGPDSRAKATRTRRQKAGVG